MRLQDRVLILTLCVQVLILLNQTVTLYHAGAQTASWETAGITGEDLNVEISLDTGRPKSILDRVERYLRGQRWFTSSWIGAWMVNDQEATQATVNINIIVTGSNVASTASVDYYIEGVPQGGGEPYRFLEAAGQSVTVGGSALENSTNLGITSHLEAMGLSTDQSWTIDYYVYAKAETTGSISGENLTMEVTETLFDTKEYEYYDPGTWSHLETNMAGPGTGGFHGNARPDAESVYPDPGFLRIGGVPGYDNWYCTYWSFMNKGIYDTPNIPYSEPGSLVIHEAHIRICPDTEPSSGYVIEIRMRNSPSWYATYIKSYDAYLLRKESVYGWTVNWTLPYLYSYDEYDSPDVSSFVQALLDDNYMEEENNYRSFLFFIDPLNTDPANCPTQVYIHHMEAGAGLLVRWGQYTASWYLLPPMSLSSMPITLDVIALSALIGATALLWRENRRNMR
jgi:hypothetical protein